MKTENDLLTYHWPYGGRFYPSAQKRYQEIVLLVPFYLGTKRHLLRHVRFLNELGFDAFSFELAFDHNDFLKGKLPIAKNNRIGAKHIYADQIEYFLNQLPGQKIIFAFSNPSASAIEAIAGRNATDVRALIADSGPTNQFMRGSYQLFKHELKVPFFPLRLGLTPLLSYGWSPHLHQDVHEHLKTFPQNFPILSIRGWKDKLIKPQYIDEIFEPHQNIDWQKLSLPECDHLKGLKQFPADYKPAVERFLKLHGSPV